MPDTKLRSIPKRNENIRWKEFGVDGILLNPSSGNYFQMDEVGITIWKYIDGQKTLQQIIEELTFYFDADEAQVAKDTTEFIEELIGKGLISVIV